MRQAKESKVTQTKTQVQVQTRTAFDVALRKANLADVEEKVLRMRYGISHELNATLEQRGADVQSATQLAQMEQRAVSYLQNASSGEGIDMGKRDAVIDRLQKIR